MKKYRCHIVGYNYTTMYTYHCIQLHPCEISSWIHPQNSSLIQPISKDMIPIRSFFVFACLLHKSMSFCCWNHILYKQNHHLSLWDRRDCLLKYRHLHWAPLQKNRPSRQAIHGIYMVFFNDFSVESSIAGLGFLDGVQKLRWLFLEMTMSWILSHAVPPN